MQRLPDYNTVLGYYVNSKNVQRVMLDIPIQKFTFNTFDLDFSTIEPLIYTMYKLVGLDNRVITDTLSPFRTKIYQKRYDSAIDSLVIFFRAVEKLDDPPFELLYFIHCVGGFFHNVFSYEELNNLVCSIYGKIKSFYVFLPKHPFWSHGGKKSSYFNARLNSLYKLRDSNNMTLKTLEYPAYHYKLFMELVINDLLNRVNDQKYLEDDLIIKLKIIKN